MKQNIDKCLAEYTTRELIQFHANLNALFLCCEDDLHIFPLLLQVQLAIEDRTDKLSKDYLKALTKLLQTN